MQAAYEDWLRPFKGDNRKALCSSCDKVIELSNMGESVLKSHIQNVDWSKELLQSCKASRHKYEMYLQQKREAKKSKAELEKRKKVHDEVTVLKKKKLKLEEEVKDLMNASEN